MPRPATLTLALLIAAPAALAQAADAPAIARLAEGLRASVVTISVQRRGSPPRASPPLGSALPGVEDPAIQEFFSRFKPPAPARIGSGVIIGAEGYILTANDIDAGAGDYLVRLDDGREFPATVVGADVRTSIGLLKIDAGPLPAVRLGDSNRLAVGDAVIAVGTERPAIPVAVPGKVRALEHHFAFGGVVSALVPYVESDVGLIDGPLFNAAGELVGLNALGHAKQTERAFAVPVNYAMDVQKELRVHGLVKRARLGFVIQEVSAALAAANGMDEPAGALVAEVEKGGPADRAGLKPGDIIVGIDSRPVRKTGDAIRIIANIKPGAMVALRVQRSGASATMTAIAGEVIQPPRGMRQP